MYHFTFIDEASLETETNPSESQEIELEKAIKKSSETKTFLKKTANFLQKVLDQPNCVRIFISKN